MTTIGNTDAPWVRKSGYPHLTCTHLMTPHKLCEAQGTVHQGDPSTRDYTGNSRCDEHAPDEEKTE